VAYAVAVETVCYSNCSNYYCCNTGVRQKTRPVGLAATRTATEQAYRMQALIGTFIILFEATTTHALRIQLRPIQNQQILLQRTRPSLKTERTAQTLRQQSQTFGREIPSKRNDRLRRARRTSASRRPSRRVRPKRFPTGTI